MTIKGYLLNTTNQKHLNTWLGSLIEWSAENKKARYHSGVVPNGVNSPISLYAPSAKETKWYVDRKICAYGNLRALKKTTTAYTSTYECTIKIPSKPIKAVHHSIRIIKDTLQENLDVQHNGLPVLEGHIIILQNTSDHNILRRGQIWHMPDSKTAYEVLGRSSTTFAIIH
jgi:YesN/AraC family two-component response regulator